MHESVRFRYRRAPTGWKKMLLHLCNYYIEGDTLRALIYDRGAFKMDTAKKAPQSASWT